MGRFRQTWIGLVSEVSWRLPGWPVKLLTAFGQAERGSFYDMLAAAEATDRPDLRRKYFEHALDESQHAIYFRDRIMALGGIDRARAAMEEAGALTSRGIVGGESLYERLGELDFLAFVHVAEAEAIEQFNVYCARELPDPETIAMLHKIMPDEKFHKAYPLHELEQRRKQGEGERVDTALRRVKWNRLKEGWLRFSRDIGHVMSSLWLFLLYAILIPPFSLLGKVERGGWQAPRSDRRPLAVAARSQG